MFTLVWWLISLNDVARKDGKGSKSELTDLDSKLCTDGVNGVEKA